MVPSLPPGRRQLFTLQPSSIHDRLSLKQDFQMSISKFPYVTFSELMQPSLKTPNRRKSLIILSTTLQPSSIHGRLLLRNFQFLALGSNIRNLSFCTCAWLCLYHFVFISQFKSLLIPRVNCPLLFWLQLLYICSKVRSSVLRVAVQRIVRAALFYTRSLKNKAEVEEWLRRWRRRGLVTLWPNSFPRMGSTCCDGDSGRGNREYCAEDL